MRLILEVKNPTEELTGICTFSLWSWDISLALNMTCFFLLSLRGSEATKQSPGRVNFRVIASMPSEQTCLQGFANDGIHKAFAFLIKNAENDSFNASALSAE